MKPLLLLTRPAGAAGPTAQAARRAGFRTMNAPLQRIVPVPWAPAGPLPDALLFTSAHAPPRVARHDRLRSLPVWAVGQQTANAARDAGFRVVHVGNRDATAVLAAAAAAGVETCWHIGGRDRAPTAVPDGLLLTPQTVYAADLADALPPRALAALRAGRVFATLLFSARAAGRFAALIDAAAIHRSHLRLVCFSPAVQQAAGAGWAATASADRPDAAAAFAAARKLWQETGHDGA